LNVKEGETLDFLTVINQIQILEFKQVIFTLDSKSVIDSFNLQAIIEPK